MIKHQILCDKCYKDGDCYRWDNGCSMDASGNGYNTDWEYIDLCFEHFKEWVIEHPKTKILKCSYVESNTSRI